jgi:hypothetical protein
VTGGQLVRRGRWSPPPTPEAGEPTQSRSSTDGAARSYACGVTESITITDLIERALAGYADLTSLGEEIDDEWSYVTDLSAAWTDRLQAVAAEQGDAPAPDAVVAAVGRALDEIAAIEDPHRAIDWLSTFPQVVLVAMDQRP